MDDIFFQLRNAAERTISSIDATYIALTDLNLQVIGLRYEVKLTKKILKKTSDRLLFAVIIICILILINVGMLIYSVN